MKAMVDSIRLCIPPGAIPLPWTFMVLTRVGLVEAPLSVRRGEGGGVGKSKKDTGYLYKAFMVARRPSLLLPVSVLRSAAPASPTL